jgi:exonuclease SbcC
VLGERREEFDRVQADLEAQRTAYVRDRQEAETKLEALRAQFADAQAQRDRVEELGPESPCPTCTRPLGANFRTVLDALEEQADTLKANGQYFRNRLKQLEREPEAVTALAERRRTLGAEVTQLERRFAKCQSAVQELGTVDRTAAQQEAQLADVRRQLAELPAGYDAERHRAARADAERLAALDRDRVRAEATVARAAQAAEARERAVAELARARSRAADVRARLAADPLDEAGVARVRAEHEAAAAAARAAEVRVAQAAGERAAARGAIEQAERSRQEVERVRGLVEEFARERLALDELDRAYTDLRTDLNFQLRPELSETASRFLADLTEGRYDALELDDQYNVVVQEDGAPKPVISGGEEDLANLVLRLAISQMIAERAGQSFSLLVLDEVFGSLDESRRAGVVELLRRLHDRFEQVIVITHIEDVREGLDRVVRVRYDAARGTSLVEHDDAGAVSAPADALADPFAADAPGAPTGAAAGVA